MTRLRMASAMALIGLLGAPVSASAQAPSPASAESEGRAHFMRGIGLYREGNFSGARAEFERAYEVAPSYRILFNLGETAFELQDYAGAVNAFSRYLTEGGEAVSPARRTEVTKSLTELEQRVGRLNVTTNVPGADIAIDGVRAGTTPLGAPIVVSVGRRTVTATVQGRLPASRALDIAGGDHLNVALELVSPEVAALTLPPPLTPALPATPAPPPTPVRAEALPTEPEHPHARSSTLFWVGVATTGALVVGSASFGVATVEANSTLNSRLAQFPGSSSGIASARSDVHSLALASDILGGAAIAAAGVTVYLGVTRRGSVAKATVGFGPTSAKLRVAF